MSTSELSSVALGLPQHLTTTAAPPSRSVSPAAIGFPSASANLYHLHAAVAALLPERSDITGSSTSQPLPLASLRHSRAFLFDLKRQADGAAASGSSSSAAAAAVGISRSGLWQTEQERTASQSASPITRRHRGEARALSDSLDALPAHWKLHNAFCSRCAGVVVPGITASSLVGEGKGKQREVEGSNSEQATRKRKRRQIGSSDLDGPPLVCLLCQSRNSSTTRSSKRRRDCRWPGPQASSAALKGYAPLTSEEKLAKRASLCKFPSVRQRDARKEAGAVRQERRPPPAVVSSKTEMGEVKPASPGDSSNPKKIKSGPSKGGEEGSTSKVSPQPAVRAPSKTMALSSSPPRNKQPMKDTSSGTIAPLSSLADPKATKSTSKPSNKVTAASSAPPPPPAPTPAPVQSGPGSSKKKDHKAALRAMLAKGGTAGKKGSDDKKKAEGSASRTSGGGGGGSGGLRDFLAGL